MKILFVCCHERYLVQNRTYDDIVKSFGGNSKHSTKIVYTNDIYLEKDFDSDNPSVVVFFDIDAIRYGDKFRFAFKKPVYVCSLDYFNFDACSKCPHIHKCAGIITFPVQTKIMDFYRNMFPTKSFLSFNGRFINSSTYKNHRLQKKYDILIYGCRDCTHPPRITAGKNRKVNIEYKLKWEKHHSKTLPERWRFYPLRRKMEDLLIKNKEKYNLKVLAQIGSMQAKKYVNESLSRLINESWLTLCCCSRVDLLMDKYIEVPGSYSAILGDIPSDYEHVFKNNIVEVTEWMTDEEILFTIDRALEDKQSLQAMTTRLGDRIHKEFDLSSATKNMDRVFDDMTPHSMNG